MKLVWMAALAALLLAGCGGDSTFTASGTLGLVALDSAEADCSSGKGGYDDIHKGASVVIYDADGKKLAVGALKSGKELGDDGLCVFDFAVPDVPSGDGPYGVEVGTRGQVSFTEDESDRIVISLGG